MVSMLKYERKNELIQPVGSELEFTLETQQNIEQLRKKFSGNSSRVNGAIQDLARLGLQANMSPLVLRFLEARPNKPSGLTAEQTKTVIGILEYLEEKSK